MTELDKMLGLSSIPELARYIRADWAKVNYAAEPYLQVMEQLKSIYDSYYADSGKSVVLYFLANAATWRGPVAKAVKAELKRRTNF